MSANTSPKTSVDSWRSHVHVGLLFLHFRKYLPITANTSEELLCPCDILPSFDSMAPMKVSLPSRTRRLLQRGRSHLRAVWCAGVIVQARPDGMSLRRAGGLLSTGEPMRLYVIAVSTWQPPLQEV